VLFREGLKLQLIRLGGWLLVPGIGWLLVPGIG